MKKLATLGVLGVFTLSPSLFAMESTMSNSNTMHTDTMVKTDTMMMHASMKMDHSMSMSMMSKPVATIAAYLGYDWKKDRAMLAMKAGIKNYRGTVSQNIMIKKYLIMISKSGVMVGGESMISIRDIVDNAVRAKNVTTLVAAVKAAGLVDTLKSSGPFTVFAPTNDAFAKLPAGTVESLVKPENKATLVDILTYHVVSGSYKSSDLTDGLVLTTVEGKKLTFTRVNGKLMINGSAMVETADVISSNGVTHVIDTVLMPPKM